MFTTEAGVPTVRETLKELGLNKSEADRRIIVLTPGLDWAGGPVVLRKLDNAHLKSATSFLGLGTLKEEEKFEGPQLSSETVYLCYSSGMFTYKYNSIDPNH